MQELIRVFTEGSPAELGVQVIGLLALAASVVSFQMKTYKGIMVLQIICAALFSVHMGLLFALGHRDAISGCASNLLCLVRDVAFWFLAKRPQKRPWIKTVVFYVLMAGVGAATWQSPVSLLCIIGMLLNTVSFSMTDPQKVRRVILFSSPFILVYDLLSASVGGAVNELISFASAVIGVLRFRKLKHGAEKRKDGYDR